MRKLSFFFLSVSMLGVSTAGAYPFPRAYDRCEEVSDFRERGTLESFLAIPVSLRVYAIADLLTSDESALHVTEANAGAGTGDKPPKPYPDLQKILNQFYSQADLETKAQINRLAFAESVSLPNAAGALKFFQAGISTKNTNLDLICTALVGLEHSPFSGYDEENMSQRAQSLLTLIPILERDPELTRGECDFFDAETKISVKIMDVMKLAAPEWAYNTARKNDLVFRAEVRNSILGKSVCSSSDLNFYLLPAIQNCGKRIGSTTHVLVQDGNCHIEGLITRTKSGFSYKANFASMNSLRPVHNFKNPAELIDILSPPKTPGSTK